MTCPECGREHGITGRILVDGTPLRATFVEVMVEIACRHGMLGIPRDDVERSTEPDVPSGCPMRRKENARPIF